MEFLYVAVDNYQTTEKNSSSGTSEMQEKQAAVSGLPPRQRVIRFADDDADDSGEEETATINATSPSAAATQTAAASRSSPTMTKPTDSRREKDEESKPSDPTPVPAPKPTTLQQKMLAMAGQDIDQFMREV